jgi:hypothetical protein
MDVTPLPPDPPEPTPENAVPRRSSTRLLVGGLVGAVVSSGIAVLVALQLAKPDLPVDTLGAATPSEQPEQIPAAEGLTAEQPRWTEDPTSWQVTLAWEPVEGAERYLVSRDGRRLDEVQGTEFEDRSVTPDGRYWYEVVAFGADGARSKAARTTIRTEALPKDAARVQGRWLLTMKVQSSSIGQGGGRFVVTLSPTCRTGPCDVRWRFARVSNTGTARRRGASYEGTGSGSFLTQGCHGETISSSVTMRFDVDEARTVGSTWRATVISGTITEYVASFSNCLSARSVWTFEGAAQG